MRKRLPRAVVLLAVFALVAAACSNDSSGETTTTQADTTTTTAATTTTTAATTTTEGPMEITTGPGVTAEPCPGSANTDRGCIYLGVLTDESGPFAPAAPALYGAQAAFWAVANASGGIGGAYDVAVPDSLKKDTQYNPEVFVSSYNDIEAQIAALAQSLGTPQTIAAIPGYVRDDTVAAPMSWWSGWSFSETTAGGAYTGDQGLVIEFGANYCFEAMNAIDWAAGALPDAGKQAATIGILEYPTDYGFDYAAGVKTAATANNMTVAWEAPVVPISAGGDPLQVEAVGQVVGNPVDIVILVTGPNETAAIVAGAVSQGFQGTFIGAGPSWNVGILASPAAAAFQPGTFYQSAYVGPWDYTSVGHETMRQAIAAVGAAPNDFFVSGWVSQYGLKAALELAYSNGDLSHAGIAAAAKGLEAVDYQGMMAPRSFQGDPNDITPRDSVVGGLDPNSSTGITLVQDFFVGSTASAYDFSTPCSQVG